MPIRFVIGRAGSGKSHRCFHSIVEAMRADPLGAPIFLIVPKQATFSAERELACGWGLGGFCRARVVSFESLGEEVLGECGGAAVPRVTSLGRQMVLGHLLRVHEQELRHFRSVARQPGLAAQLDATFAELERCGNTAADLAAIFTEIQASASSDRHDQALLARLHDLKHLYDAYSAFLGQERLDQHRRLTQVLESLQSCRQVQQSIIHVDGFLEFTEYERRMLGGVAKVCASMEINLLLDPSSKLLSDPHWMSEDLELFHRTEQTYHRLWCRFNEDEIEIDPPLILLEQRRFSNDSLAHLERHLFDASCPKTSQQAHHIRLIEAPDHREEVDAAAREIRALVDDGFRYREIAVLARDLEAYHELIDAAFSEHEIPYFVDRRRTAAHHPLLQITRAVFLIALHHWQHDALMTVGKSGLASLPFDQVDELANYVLDHRIRGDVWGSEEPWTFRRNLTRQSEGEISIAGQVELEHIDALRRRLTRDLIPFVARLQSEQKLSIRRIVLELFGLYERLGVRATLLKWMAEALERNQLEQHDEHQQVWSEVVQLFDQMVDLLGEQQVSVEEFLEILEFGLDQFDLALTPPTIDQVLVGEVERTRGAQVRAVILLGLNDGQFPRATREGTILSDDERRALRKHKVHLDPDVTRKLLDENLLGYIGLTRASEHLLLIRNLADNEGRPRSPSPFWDRVRDLLPSVKPQRIVRAGNSIKNIGTPRQLVTTLMRWARAQNEPNLIDRTDSSLPALYQWLAAHPCDPHSRDPIDIMRFHAWNALGYCNQARLSSLVATQIFRTPLQASVSRLETFATCPFKHFVRYGLKLQLREEEQVTAIDLGIVYHSILEKIVKQMLEQRADWGSHPPDVAQQLIKSYAQDVATELRGELMLSSARNKYLLQRVQKTLWRIMAAHQAAERHSKLRPWKAELQFGGEGAELPPLNLTTPGGAKIELRGKIDRVDLLENETAFAVIDYKLQGDTLELQRVYHGLSLQLLTYLLVLQSSGIKLDGRKLTPAAAFYVRLLRNIELQQHPDDAPSPDDPLFDLKEKPRGILNGHFVEAFDTQLASGRSNVVQVYINKDGGFGHKRSSDATEPQEFAALLRLVERKLGELGDQILEGQIGVTPYRLNQRTPCSHCDYRSVCRFDIGINRYRPLQAMRRDEVLARVMAEAANE